jgi:hypothetical protein
VERAILVEDTLGEQKKTFQVIWEGTALVKPVSGTVQRLSMGQITTDVESILVPGRHTFVQGDFVHLKGSLYEVQRTADYNRTFQILDLNKYQQQP